MSRLEKPALCRSHLHDSRRDGVDSDTFACIRCGETVYYAAEFCPHCGLDLHPGSLDESELPLLDDHPQVRRRPSTRVGAVISGVLIGLLCATVAWAFVPGSSPTVIVVLCCGLGLAGAIAGAMRWGHPSRPTPAGENEEVLYRELLRQSGGDHARVERLLDFERKFAPTICRRELLNRALARLQRDRR